MHRKAQVWEHDFLVPSECPFFPKPKGRSLNFMGPGLSRQVCLELREGKIAEEAGLGWKRIRPSDLGAWLLYKSTEPKRGGPGLLLQSRLPPWVSRKKDLEPKCCMASL